MIESDILRLEEKGITPEQFQAQLDSFKKGFPYLELSAAASVEKGIMVVSPQDEQGYLDNWDAYRTDSKKIMKFVPASGAASRMFKDLFEFLDAPYEVPTSNFEKTFFDGLKKNSLFTKTLTKLA